MDTVNRCAAAEMDFLRDCRDGGALFGECQGLEKELLAAAFLEEVDIRTLPFESQSAQRMIEGYTRLKRLSPFDGVSACLKILQPDEEER